MIRIILAVGLLALSSCGFVVPGTPGHEPQTFNVNPITGVRGSNDV